MLQTIVSYVGIFALCGLMLYVAERRKMKKYFRKMYGTNNFREGMRRYKESLAAARKEARTLKETEEKTNSGNMEHVPEENAADENA
jgi:hypothetical protein